MNYFHASALAHGPILIINGEKFGSCFMQFIDFMWLINDLINTHIPRYSHNNNRNYKVSTCKSHERSFIQVYLFTLQVAKIFRKNPYADGYKVNSSFSAHFLAFFFLPLAIAVVAKRETRIWATISTALWIFRLIDMPVMTHKIFALNILDSNASTHTHKRARTHTHRT